MMRSKCEARGFVLITTMMLLSLLLVLAATCYTSTFLEISTVKDSKNSVSGFFAAESGLNVRADLVRGLFLGFNRPTGTSPSSASPCEGGNQGSGDFACQTFTFNKRSVRTYVVEPAGNPVTVTIPPGERYQNLAASEYRYIAKAESQDPRRGIVESDLELRFKSRQVPLFQFAFFYNKDLELLPQETMNINGPIHANGDVYFNSSSAILTVNGQITTSGRLYRGRKDSNTCDASSVRVYNPTTATTLISSCSSRVLPTASQLAEFNAMIQTQVQPVTVPEISVIDPTPTSAYWKYADLRVVMTMTAADAFSAIQVRNLDNSVNTSATTALTACSGVTGTSNNRAVGYKTVYNPREAGQIKLLDVDVTGVLNCLKSSNWFGTGKALNDTTEGGLVFYFSVIGNNSNSSGNFYGVRLRNASAITSTLSGALRPRGLTVATDQAMYLMGNYNVTSASYPKIPASLVADSFNVLSSSWDGSNCSGTTLASCPFTSRVAGNTTLNAALLAGTDTTGIEGSGGQGGTYGGGGHNFPRLMENWSGKTLTIRGSFVSLGKPRHVDGLWAQNSPYYNVPGRNFDYDTSFNDPNNLPPLSMRFVYLRQELFVRDFQR